MLYEVITPTVLVFQNGEVVGRQVGVAPKKTYTDAIDAFVITSYSIHYTKLYDMELGANKGRACAIFERNWKSNRNDNCRVHSGKRIGIQICFYSWFFSSSSLPSVVYILVCSWCRFNRCCVALYYTRNCGWSTFCSIGIVYSFFRAGWIRAFFWNCGGFRKILGKYNRVLYYAKYTSIRNNFV